MRRLIVDAKILVEPTAAVPAAAVLEGRIDVAGRRVGIVISGGNADPELVADLLDASQP